MTQSQVAYIFDPDDDETHRERPSKRRRVSKQAKSTSAANEAEPPFVPLLNGKESAASVRLRQRLYEESLAKVDARLQVRLYGVSGTTAEDQADEGGTGDAARVQLGDIGAGDCVCGGGRVRMVRACPPALWC